MIIVSSAPFATAIRAIRLNSQEGMLAPAASTTDSSGPLDSYSSDAGSAMELATPTSTYTAPAVKSAPKRARG